MKPQSLDIGSIVSVHFYSAQITLSHEAEVLYIPVATGDSWKFKDLRTGEIHYVSEGCTITLKESDGR